MKTKKGRIIRLSYKKLLQENKYLKLKLKHQEKEIKENFEYILFEQQLLSKETEEYKKFKKTILNDMK